MPRTKRVRKILKDSNIDVTTDISNPKDINGFLKQIENVANGNIHSTRGKLDSRIMDIERLVGSIKLKIKPNILAMTFNEFGEMTRNKSHSSVDSVRKIETFNVTKPNRTKTVISASKLRTPCDQHIPAMPIVTPKVNPNLPISVLRRPHQGECALSLDGSPLLVSNVCNDKVASVSVPMKDGRVISILPTEGIEGACFDLDEHTRRQLEMLTKNLTKCLHK